MSHSSPANQQRLLAAGDSASSVAVSLGQHHATHGELPRFGRSNAAWLAQQLSKSGLRGRGGAGFPAGLKFESMVGARSPVVVVNGTEGERVSLKDRFLLSTQPQLVLDGAVAAARCLGAKKIAVVAPQDLHPGLASAIGERASYGLREPAFSLVQAGEGYVAGEETAVVARVEGKPALPRVKPPRPTESGVNGKPTLIHNVESFAHTALIARHGGDWFSTVGSQERPGTTLVTITGSTRHTGVLEVPVGTPLSEIVQRAGGSTEPLSALLIGGYAGGWVPATSAATLTDSELRPYGAGVGAGVVLALAESECPVAAIGRIVQWLAAESAGQCGPCVNGLGAIAEAIVRLGSGDGSHADLQRLGRWLEMVNGRGACGHPSGVSRMVSSAMGTFEQEFEEHAQLGVCGACARRNSASNHSDRRENQELYA